MQNTSLRNLGDATISAASADADGEVITSASGDAYASELGDAEGATITVNFTFGSGGATLKVAIDTSLDQGDSWIEVARFAFTTASKKKVINLSTETPLTTPYEPVALSDDTCKDGVFGDLWRARKIVGATPYAGNSAVSVRMQPR